MLARALLTIIVISMIFFIFYLVHTNELQDKTRGQILVSVAEAIGEKTEEDTMSFWTNVGKLMHRFVVYLNEKPKR